MAKQAVGFWGRVELGLAPGGLVLVKVFTTRGPSYERLKARELPEVEEGTFYSPRLRTYLFFLKPGGLRELFSGLELVSYSEGFSLDITHDEPHYHGWASLVARRHGGHHHNLHTSRGT